MRKKLRVCAYCRVSTDADEQMTSFDSQVRAYTDLIKSNSEYVFAGVYADRGVTGTSVNKRPEFMRMIRDCEEGKIDLILTKSISRFARNTLECLTYVRSLNSRGVHIVFENNGIDTRSSYSEMLLTVLSAFAQEESRSISENTIWGIRKRYETGKSRWSRLYGYVKTEDGEYVIVPEQAEIVRFIFDSCEHGMSVAQITQELNALHIPSPTSSGDWHDSTVGFMLRNERYAGDIVLQKYFTENHITHKHVRNDGSVPSYHLRGHHAAIIGRKQFERVQKILDMRRMRTPSGACSMSYPFGSKIVCPVCRRPLKVSSGSLVCGPDGFSVKVKNVKKELLKLYPQFERVDYWWIDDLINQISFKSKDDLTLVIEGGFYEGNGNTKEEGYT